MAARGHSVTFFEKDVPYYRMNRDLYQLPADGQLCLYDCLSDIARDCRRALNNADLAMVTSYCPDGRAAARLVLDSQAALKVFYDLDTPITLQHLADGEDVEYLPANGLADFDLVLSYTGGKALEDLQRCLGARAVAPLYGSVDTTVHHGVTPIQDYRADLSYLGTYAADRQSALEGLFLEPARRLAEKRFLIGGAQYPEAFPWTGNIFFVRHTPPSQHPAFFCSSRATLNVTRQGMANNGFCPSGRLFEATACGVPVLSDGWKGLETFFAPGRELLIVKTAQDVVEALQLSDRELQQIARAGQERTLEEHTAERRVLELEALCEGAGCPVMQAHGSG